LALKISEIAIWCPKKKWAHWRILLGGLEHDWIIFHFIYVDVIRNPLTHIFWVRYTTNQSLLSAVPFGWWSKLESKTHITEHPQLLAGISDP
jgi:hypothetical protein